MKTKNLVLTFFGCLLTFIASPEAQEIQQYRLLKFPVKNMEQIRELKLLGLTLDAGPVVDNHIQVIVNEAEPRKLQDTNLTVLAFIDNQE